MMKRLLCYLILAGLALGTTGCLPDEGRVRADIPLAVTVVDGIPVKSALDRDGTEVANLTVALYADGILCRAYYLDELTAPSLPEVPLARRYTVYALANVDGVSFPALEQDVPAMTLDWNSVRQGDSWPMGFSGELQAATGATLAVRLVRLVARVDLAVDAEGLSQYTFQAQRVMLKSGAGDCRPFVARSVPVAFSAKPDEATAADLTALNAGQCTSYYLFESCFGDLLPDNHDAWDKVPSSLEQGVTPPYVEVDGVLTVSDNSGTTRPVTYRFYLGQNATCNFDVVRNTVNTVTLVLTNDNLDRGSWKVEAGPYDERASLAFRYGEVALPWLSSVTTPLLITPSNLKYRVFEKDGSMSNAGLAFFQNGHRITITSTREGVVHGTLYAATPDGRIETVCRIWTYEPPVTLKQIVLTCKNEYSAYEDVYTVDAGREFNFQVDLVYSDGTVETDVMDRTGFEWVISDLDVVSPTSDRGFDLAAMEPGEVTVYLKNGEVYSAMYHLVVSSPTLSVRAVPNRIECGGSSVLMAVYGSGTVDTNTQWEILEGQEYGSLGKRVYTTFYSNGLNDSEVTVVIAGTYNGVTRTCAVTVEAPEGGQGSAHVTHALVVTPGTASVAYNEAQAFTATYQTFTDGVLTEERNVSERAYWIVSDPSVARASVIGSVRGINRQPVEVTVTVTAMYAGCEASATLTVGAAPDNPNPDPDPPGPPDNDPVLAGITLSLDKDRVWYGESVQATVTAWYDDGSHADVTSKVGNWPELTGFTRSGGCYTHSKAGLRADILQTLAVSYASFGASATVRQCRRYVTRVEAVFPEALSKSAGESEKPAFRLVFNDGTILDGLPGDLDSFRVDGGGAMPGGAEIYARDLSTGEHTLTVYVYAENRAGNRVLMSGTMIFTAYP